MKERTDPELQTQIDAATSYEEFFVPAVFHQWPPRVLDAAEVTSGQRVLDVACGTGVLARAALPQVGPKGFVAGLDRNPGMLAVAARIEPRVDWRHGMAESLPFSDQSFDAVVSQFGLMFFTDRVQAVREMQRVATDAGRLAVAVWDSLKHTPAYAEEVALVRRIAGERAAEPLRAPFALGDGDALAALFAAAGVRSVSVTTHQGVARFPNIRFMLDADIRGWLPLMGVRLGEDDIRRIFDEGERVLSRYVAPDGTLVVYMPALIVSGRKG